MSNNFDKNRIIQGDVILERVDALPTNAKPTNLKQKKNGVDVLVLQESEVTGHHHHFMGDDTGVIEAYSAGDSLVTTITKDLNKYIKVLSPAMLLHGNICKVKEDVLKTKDHSGVLIPPSIYRVRITRAYDYNAEEDATVID